MDAVALEQQGIGLGIAQIVDRDQLEIMVGALQDRARDLGGAVYAAASFAFFCESKNCSSSVEPCSAVVEAAPPATTWVIWSK